MLENYAVNIKGLIFALCFHGIRFKVKKIIRRDDG